MFLVDAENRDLYEKKGQEKTYKLVCMPGSGNRPDDWGDFQQRFGVPEAVEFFSSMEGVFSLLNRERSG